MKGYRLVYVIHVSHFYNHRPQGLEPEGEVRYFPNWDVLTCTNLNICLPSCLEKKHLCTVLYYTILYCTITGGSWLIISCDSLYSYQSCEIITTLLSLLLSL